MAAPLALLLADAPQFLFFTGKGGVGKTSLACATALSLAEAGRSVLLISTDPASNLDEVLETTLGMAPTAVMGVPGLNALNINPESAAENYREKVIGPVRDLLPQAALEAMTEQLSGACTMEIATFDQFVEWVAQPTAPHGYDHFVFDTAPTGHTLRLLALPAAWTVYLDENQSGNSCIGPLAGLARQRERYALALDRLSDGLQTLLVLVARPQKSAFEEAARSSHEFRQLGIARQLLVINGFLPDAVDGDDFAAAYRERQRAALAGLPVALETLETIRLPLQARNLIGLDALRTVVAAPDTECLYPEPLEDGDSPGVPAAFMAVEALVHTLSASDRGVVITMGKGGVGKTTLAAALAVALADRGHAVHLSTTDPAPHLQGVLGGGIPNLTVDRIDPVTETAAYRDRVLAEQSPHLDAEGLALLMEDLRSPCTEEIAVFQAFAETVARADSQWVILDTAPTGHTLLLLDTTEAYHRELHRQSRSSGTVVAHEAVRKLLPRLRDPAFTKVLLVTLPEPTPVHEAAMLQEDLRRAGIEPWAWVANQVLTGLPLHNPLLVSRARAESRWLDAIDALAARAAFIPWQRVEPSGPTALRSLFFHPYPEPCLHEKP